MSSSESISAITVKVEGEAKSQCYREPIQGRRRSKRPVVELHKVLYLTRVVFPDSSLSSLKTPSSASSFTLPPGKHSWPFSFQIPVNNDCKIEPRSTVGAIISGDVMSPQQRHVQQILPPSMIGNYEVWVRYFVKVTVDRPFKLVLNRREQVPFVFLPIEAPRAEEGTSGEAFFVRRQCTLGLPDGKMKGMMRFFGQDSPQSRPDNIAIEIRLANPPLLVPGIPVNMDIMGFIESNYNDHNLVITQVSIYLLVTTKVKAGGLKRTFEHHVRCYDEDFNKPMIPQADKSKPAALISLIHSRPFTLATDTAPTFSTCNIARSYHLGVDVTVTRDSKAKEKIVLNCPVTILSGVRAPPPQDNFHVIDHDDVDAYEAGPSNGGKGGADLPTYKEAVKIGAPSSASVIPNNYSRAAIRTRTSYRVGEAYDKDSLE